MADILKISNSGPLIGRCGVPGDKSISHRAVIFSSLADGPSRIRNFLDGHDCRATMNIMRAMGVRIDEISSTQLEVHGVGLDGLKEPDDVLNCDNSGTTMRLLTGLLAGQEFVSVLSGTAQIRGRPMARIVDPLRTMGAQIYGRQNGRYAPLTVVPSRLSAIEYKMPVASAQVKSCLLLAGLFAHGLTVVHQPGPARDHTERMLSAMGAPVNALGNTTHSERPQDPLNPLNMIIPGDISSAAFLLVAASAVPDSKLTIVDVGVNATRTGIVDALSEMGADIRRRVRPSQGGEPVADLIVSGGGLQGLDFGGEQLVTMIDELPVLAVAATQAAGRTVVRDAQELRVKETDRIATTVSELKKMGAQIQETPDGFIVDGPTPLNGATVDSHGDHRLAMALAVAGLIADGETTIYNAHVTADSFPGFESTLRALDVNVQEMGWASENE